MSKYIQIKAMRTLVLLDEDDKRVHDLMFMIVMYSGLNYDQILENIKKLAAGEAID